MQNKGITLALYGALFIILFSSVYLYCQKRKEQIDLEQDRIEVDNEINKTYRTDIGAGASTEGGSSFSENSADAEKPEVAAKETRPASPSTQPAEKPAPVAKQVPPASTAPVKTDAPKTNPPKPATAPKPAPAAAKKWVVRAGTFLYVEGARERLEEVINAGFPDAEIIKTKDDKFTVLVSRTSDKAAALRMVEKLENKGVEAAVFTQ
jgi:cell division protein FtsN